MKLLAVSLVLTTLSVSLALPFSREARHREELIPLAHSLGATRFVHFIHEANLTANFTKKAGNFTLFVPDNAAFKDLSRNISGNKTLLKDLLLFHSVKGTYTRDKFTLGKKIRTLSGKYLVFNVTKTRAVLVNGVNITKFNQRATNGEIFILSKVILEGSGLKNATNSTKSNLVLGHQVSMHCRNGTHGTNCTHHGNGTHSNGTHGMSTLCLNGTLGVNCTHHGNGSHSNGTHGNMTHGSITHILSQGYGQYSTLIADLMKSGVWSELERPQVTLLAPTNAAFSKLPTAYRNNLDNHAKFLESTMMYHVLDGIHAPTSLHQNDMLTSVEGHRIHVSMQNGHVHQFNKASILKVIHATNGVIYVLNGVLHLPSNPIV
ncbi:transforming growth factor-beta-induced protein ig-h3-like [Haliotis cracherodii]|uniref:transforming growth factor-beta-induced protein ig-h3-like n=1 Tax=Haliotis cracherodii TaxID=6455 RepID=UPI0039EB304F